MIVFIRFNIDLHGQEFLNLDEVEKFRKEIDKLLRDRMELRYDSDLEVALELSAGEENVVRVPK